MRRKKVKRDASFLLDHSTWELKDGAGLTWTVEEPRDPDAIEIRFRGWVSRPVYGWNGVFALDAVGPSK